MRALRVHRLGEPTEALALDEVDLPIPGDGQARLRVQFAALNLPDAMLCRGTYALSPPLPFTPGLDAGGVIDAVGPDGDSSLIGRRVTSVPVLPAGALAQYCLVKTEALYEVPSEVDMGDAVAGQVAFQTAHLSLHHRGQLQRGESLVVLGAAGGVGSAAIQLGVLAGARVIAVAGGADKVEACRELGAHHVFDHRVGPFAEHVMELTDGLGADVIYDPVGGAGFHEARTCLAVDGRLLVVGFASGDRPKVSAASVLFGSYSVVGVYIGAYSRTARGRALLQAVHAEVMGLVASGALQIRIDRVVGLGDVGQALADMENRTIVGKVLVSLTR
jgi:NADPH2:quinone reductase